MSLTRIDDLRERAEALAYASNAKLEVLALEERSPAETRESLRAELAHVEQEIDSLLMKRIALKDCPYCPGKLEPTPTKHVLKCDLCNATTLPGKMEVVTHG